MSTHQQTGFAAAPPIALDPPGGGVDLVRGLLLLRASSMNLIRFQLAMERRDRRVALETVDELVAIDGCLRDFIQDMSAPDDTFAEFAREVEQQRASLVREKLTLVAGKTGPAVRQDQPEWVEPPVPAPEAAVEEDTPPPVRRSWPVWLLVALSGLIVAAIAVAALVWGTQIGGETAARLPL